jgi:hypothetical protein
MVQLMLVTRKGRTLASRPCGLGLITATADYEPDSDIRRKAATADFRISRHGGPEPEQTLSGFDANGSRDLGELARMSANVDCRFVHPRVARLKWRNCTDISLTRAMKLLSTCTFILRVLLWSAHEQIWQV